MPARTDKDYYATNLLSDVLGLGESSRLQHALKKKQNYLLMLLHILPEVLIPVCLLLP